MLSLSGRIFISEYASACNRYLRASCLPALRFCGLTHDAPRVSGSKVIIYSTTFNFGKSPFSYQLNPLENKKNSQGELDSKTY